MNSAGYNFFEKICSVGGSASDEDDIMVYIIARSPGGLGVILTGERVSGRES